MDHDSLRLPSSLEKQIERLNLTDVDYHEVDIDVYKYEEHSMKNNHRSDFEHTENSEGEMMDGILTSTSKPSYELPSQEKLIRKTFAGDDMEDDEFEKDKQEIILNEEKHEPAEKPAEKPVILLPGWGNWTGPLQRDSSWWLEKHRDDQKKWDEEFRKKMEPLINLRARIIERERARAKHEPLKHVVLLRGSGNWIEQQQHKRASSWWLKKHQDDQKKRHEEIRKRMELWMVKSDLINLRARVIERARMKMRNSEETKRALRESIFSHFDKLELE